MNVVSLARFFLNFDRHLFRICSVLFISEGQRHPYFRTTVALGVTENTLFLANIIMTELKLTTLTNLRK